MEECNLFSCGFWEIDEGVVEGFYVAAGEVFEEATEGDEVVGLG